MRIRERVRLVASLGAVGLSVLAVGGALRWVQAAVGVLVAIAIVADLPSRRHFARRSPLVVALGVATGLTALQLVPLPDGVIATLHPTGAALRDQGTMLAGVRYWPSLSMDPAGTLGALCFFLILLGVAVVALRIAASERGRYAVLAAVAGVCGIAALVAGVHELLGATALYGVYTPAQATPLVLGPLLNENHFAGLSAIGAVTASCLFARTTTRSSVRLMWACSAITCVIVTFATGSRGGALALIGGTVVMLLVLLAQRLRRGKRVKQARTERFIVTSLPLGVVALCTLVLILYASASGLADQLGDTSLSEISEPRSKFAAWRSSATLVAESPWVGQGRGAFEPAFTRIHPASAFATFSHLENEYLQAVVDWGLPGALLLALTVGWLALAILRRWRDGPLAAAALGGVAVVVVQSNVDFGIELLGLAVPATALAAAMAYVPLRDASRRTLVRSRLVRGLHAGLLVSGAVVLTTPLTTSVAEDHQAIVKGRLGLDDLQRSIERHPLDYLGYARAAGVLLEARDPRAVSYLNHALVLHPTHAGLHTVAARMLRASGRDPQAAIEYEAALRGRVDPAPLLRELVATFSRVESIVASIPLDHPRVELIVRTLVDLERRDIATAWLTRVLEHRPTDLGVCDLLYAQAVNGGDLKAAEVSGRHCLKVNPSPRRQLALARVLFRRGNHAETIELLADVHSWRGRVDELGGAWLMLCDSHEALKHWDDARKCLRRLDGHGLLAARRSEITRRLERVAKAQLDEEGGLVAPGSLMPKILK